MDLSKQGKQNNEKAERLARRNECGQQRRLDETAEEREINLAKRREAWKNKTAEVKGKQKEYQRVYRQQKKAAESSEEKESCLVKRRKAAKEKTAKIKGKQNEYERVYRKQKLIWQSGEKQGEKQRVSKPGIIQEIKYNLKLNMVKLRDFK